MTSLIECFPYKGSPNNRNNRHADFPLADYLIKPFATSYSKIYLLALHIRPSDSTLPRPGKIFLPPPAHTVVFLPAQCSPFVIGPADEVRTQGTRPLAAPTRSPNYPLRPSSRPRHRLTAKLCPRSWHHKTAKLCLLPDAPSRGLFLHASPDKSGSRETHRTSHEFPKNSRPFGAL